MPCKVNCLDTARLLHAVHLPTVPARDRQRRRRRPRRRRSPKRGDKAATLHRRRAGAGGELARRCLRAERFAEASGGHCAV